MRTLRTILSRDDFFSEHYREAVIRQYAAEIGERCEEIAVAGEGTSREMFHLACDITEKCLKQRDKLLNIEGNGESDDDEAYYVPGSGLPNPAKPCNNSFQI